MFARGTALLPGPKRVSLACSVKGFGLSVRCSAYAVWAKSGLSKKRTRV